MSKVLKFKTDVRNVCPRCGGKLTLNDGVYVCDGCPWEFKDEGDHLLGMSSPPSPPPQQVLPHLVTNGGKHGKSSEEQHPAPLPPEGQ